jgi:3-oxoadipate enol-lactonase
VIRGAVGTTGVAYCVDGQPEGHPIVFINSLGTDHRLWDAQAAAVGSTYRAIRYESCGHGVSDPPVGDMTIPRFGRDLVALLDHLGIARAALCGCSLGGVIALWVSANHPDRVAGAVLANTGAKVGTDEAWDARIAAVRSGGMASIQPVVLRRFLTSEFRCREPRATALVGEMLQATNPLGYIAACHALRASDLRAVASTVRVPTLIVGSDRDESTPLALARELHASIAGSELVVIPDAAHLSNVERPDVFNAHLLRFCSEIWRAE